MGDLAVGEVSGYPEVKGGTLGTQTFRKFPYKKIHGKFPKAPSLSVTRPSLAGFSFRDSWLPTGS